MDAAFMNQMLAAGGVQSDGLTAAQQRLLRNYPRKSLPGLAHRAGVAALSHGHERALGQRGAKWLHQISVQARRNFGPHLLTRRLAG